MTNVMDAGEREVVETIELQIETSWLPVIIFRSSLAILFCFYAYLFFSMPGTFLSFPGFLLGLLKFGLFFCTLRQIWLSLCHPRLTTVASSLATFVAALLFLAFAGMSDVAMWIILTIGAFSFAKTFFRRRHASKGRMGVGGVGAVGFALLVVIAQSSLGDVENLEAIIPFYLDMFKVDGVLEDEYFHNTLILSILEHGYPSTGLHGVVFERYHAFGHACLAGFYRLLGLSSLVSPVMLTTFLVSYLLSIAAMVASYIGFCLINGSERMIDKPAALMALPAVSAAFFFIFIEIVTVVNPQSTFHIYVLSNGVAMCLLGIGGVYFLSMLVSQERQAGAASKAVLALICVCLFLCTFAKISSGLVLFVSGLTYYAWRAILSIFSQGEVGPAFTNLGLFSLIGGVCLWVGYILVSGLAAETKLFDSTLIAQLFEKTQSYIYVALIFAAINSVIWGACMGLYGQFSWSAMLGTTLLSFSGITATTFVLLTTIVSNYNDLAYMHISAIQLLLFSTSIGGGLILFKGAVFALSLMPESGLFRRGGSAVSSILMALLFAGVFTNLAATAGQSQKTQLEHLCAELNAAFCRDGAKPTQQDVFDALSDEHPAAKIVRDVRHSFQDVKKASDVSIIIDKDSGFFTHPTSGRWKEVPCYRMGWAVFSGTGSPLYYGYPEGLEAENLCAFPSKSYSYLWRRYGHVEYTVSSAGARSYTPQQVSLLCSDETIKSEHIAFFDESLTLQRIDCGRS